MSRFRVIDWGCMIRKLLFRLTVLLVAAVCLKMAAVAGWDLVKEKWAANKTAEADLLAYLEHYPKGKYRGQVEAKLSEPAIRNNNRELLEKLVHSEDPAVVDRCRPALCRQLSELVYPVLLDPLAACRGKQLETYVHVSGLASDEYERLLNEYLATGRLGRLFTLVGLKVVPVKSEAQAVLSIQLKVSPGASYRSLYDRQAAPVTGHYAEGKVLWRGQQLFDIGEGSGDLPHDIAISTAGNWERRLESKIFPRRGPREESL